MADSPLDRMRQKLHQATAKEEAKSEQSGAGDMDNNNQKDEQVDKDKPKEGDLMTGPDLDNTVQTDEGKDVKSGTDKAEAAEEVTRRAKALDQEDTREETSGEERHDLVIPSELNIPPTIVAERLRMGQNPATGLNWSQEERMEYDRNLEQGRQRHQQAIRQAEQEQRDAKAKEQEQENAEKP